MSDNLKIFREEYLNANSWAQRKDGVPLDLMDNLSDAEKEIAEKELIDNLSIKDDWTIMGLGYLKSQRGLKKLYDLLPTSKKGMKVTIAHSIFQICADKKMVEIAVTEIPQISNQYELIHIIYLLRDFKNDKVNEILNDLRNHKEYLVSYNATQAMGLSTDSVVEKFRKKKSGGFWSKLKSKITK